MLGLISDCSMFLRLLTQNFVDNDPEKTSKNIKKDGLSADILLGGYEFDDNRT